MTELAPRRALPVITACFSPIRTHMDLVAPPMSMTLNPPYSSLTSPRYERITTRLKVNNAANPNSSPGGRINRLVLTNEGRTKLNPAPDREFYVQPRFVTHVDDSFISRLKNLYRERIKPGSDVLDLMSSWVSHLPEEVNYGRVVGHGLNAQELTKNPRLDYFFIKDLNEDQIFEIGSDTFDAVLCAVGIQYLQQPEKVFAEVFRILRPGGVFIVSFSNRVFYEKAIGAWRDGTEYSRVQLVVQYFQAVEGFTSPEVIRGEQRRREEGGLQWIRRLLRNLRFVSDPFYAVIAYRNFKPIHE